MGHEMSPNKRDMAEEGGQQKAGISTTRAEEVLEQTLVLVIKGVELQCSGGKAAGNQ